jgi:hypothetical protein
MTRQFSAASLSSFLDGVPVLLREGVRRLVERPNGPFSCDVRRDPRSGLAVLLAAIHTIHDEHSEPEVHKRGEGREITAHCEGGAALGCSFERMLTYSAYSYAQGKRCPLASKALSASGTAWTCMPPRNGDRVFIFFWRLRQ